MYINTTPSNAMSSHSNHSGKKRKSLTNAMLEHISSSSIQSGGGKSIRSVRSDGGISIQSVNSNKSNNGSIKSHHSDYEDGKGDLGPVLMIDILVTKHIDFKLSC